MTAATDTFRPALIVVDLQEDFCPPNGSLAVPNGRAVAPVINKLLTSPAFAIRVATKDWHPQSHVSFAANHVSKEPFVDFATITNPLNGTESYETRLWPVHCVQDTPGAALIPELDLDRVDEVLEKGTRSDVEMYSAFYPPLKDPRVGDSGLAGLLREKAISHVYVVGLAADYCVKSTALDAAAEGFATAIVEEGTKPVDPGAWPTMKQEIVASGVKIVDMDSEEIKKLFT